jgi:hypothetical protein
MMTASQAWAAINARLAEAVREAGNGMTPAEESWVAIHARLDELAIAATRAVRATDICVERDRAYLLDFATGLDLAGDLQTAERFRRIAADL